MCHLCSLPAHDAFITLVCHLFNSREGHFLPAFSFGDVFLNFPLLLFILSCSELCGLSEELHPQKGVCWAPGTARSMSCALSLLPLLSILLQDLGSCFLLCFNVS